MTHPIRTADQADIPGIQAVFRSAVLHMAATHYDAAQRRAWAARADDAGRWEQALREQDLWVAMEGDQVKGFISLTPEGHIDFLYVHADHGRRGVAQALFDALMTEAESRAHPRLTTDASHTARPFFERQGFRVLQRNERELDGVVLENFRMERMLGP